MRSNFLNNPIMQSLQTISLFYFISFYCRMHSMLITNLNHSLLYKTNSSFRFGSEGELQFQIRMEMCSKKWIFMIIMVVTTLSVFSRCIQWWPSSVNPKGNILISIFDGIPQNGIKPSQNECTSLISTN